MDKLIKREGRNTRFAYGLFFYGIIFIPIMVMVFRHGTRGAENFPAYIFSGLVSLICAILLYTMHTRLRFNVKFVLLLVILTLLNIFIWVMLCDGTFIYKELF